MTATAKLAACGLAAVIAVLLAGAALRAASRSPRYCGFCHFMQPYYRTWVLSNYSAYRHSAAFVDCQSCHPRTMRDLLKDIGAALSGSHDENHLPVSKLTSRDCLVCHESYVALARRTAGRKINPHATHLGEEECSSCHRMHGKSIGLKYCATCHHTGELVGCGRCHKGRKADEFRRLRNPARLQ